MTMHVVAHSGGRRPTRSLRCPVLSLGFLLPVVLCGAISVGAQAPRQTLPPRISKDGDCKTFDADGFCVCNSFEHISCEKAGDAPFYAYTKLLETECDDDWKTANCTSTCTYYIDTLFVNYAECPARKALPTYKTFDQYSKGCTGARRWMSMYTLGLVVGACTPKVSLTKEEGYAAAATVNDSGYMHERLGYPNHLGIS